MRRLTRTAIGTLLVTGLLVPTTTAGAATKRAFHPTAALGKGKRKVRVLTCNDTISAGQFTTRYKATTRKSSDSHYPRVEIAVAEGSSTSSGEFSLFPGGRTKTDSSGPWSAAAQITFVLHNQGKTKKKVLTVGDIGAC